MRLRLPFWVEVTVVVILACVFATAVIELIRGPRNSELTECLGAAADHESTISRQREEIEHLHLRVDILSEFVHQDCKECLREVKP